MCSSHGLPHLQKPLESLPGCCDRAFPTPLQPDSVTGATAAEPASFSPSYPYVRAPPAQRFMALTTLRASSGYTALLAEQGDAQKRCWPPPSRKHLLCCVWGWVCETLLIHTTTSSADMLSLVALKPSLNSTSKPTSHPNSDQWDYQGNGSSLWDHLTIIFKQNLRFRLARKIRVQVETIYPDD